MKNKPYFSHKRIREIIKEDFSQGECSPANPDSFKASKIISEFWEQSDKFIEEELELYTVLSHRWGDEEDHTYLVGSFRTLEKAIAVAKSHREYRGGKYETVVYKDRFNGDPEKVFSYETYLNEIIKLNREQEEN